MNNKEKDSSSGRAFQLKQKTLFSRIKRLRENATPAEINLKAMLDLCGIKYIFQKGFIQGNGYYVVDFYLPKPRKIVIEVDGNSHDGREEYDKRKDDYLKKRKFKIVRITNQEVLKKIPRSKEASLSSICSTAFFVLVLQ